MFLELLIILFIFIISFDYLNKKKANDLLSWLPGPKPLPIFGNALSYVGQTPEDIFHLVSSNCKKYGTLYRVWIFHRPTVLCTNPKDAELLLTSSKHITKNGWYDILVGWLGKGLIVSTGQKWHSRRKIITPTFHFKILEQFVEVFEEQSIKFVEEIRCKADGKTAFDVYPFVCRMALDIIAETAMGTKLFAQKNPKICYVKDVSDITALLSERVIKSWYRVDTIFGIFRPDLYKKQQQTIQRLHDFTENVIQKRKEALEKEMESKIANDEETRDTKKMALLDVLLKSKAEGKLLSNEDIREEVDTFMFAGHDTTTNSISFTLFLLSRHPEVQQKVFEEIRDVLGDVNKKIMKMADLNSLKYLDCVIRESLRVYPPLALIGRRLQEDFEIHGQKIPAGTDFNIGIFVMMKDEKYFPKPHEFIPERHMTDKLNPYAYIPFSAGPRNCIGQKYAALEMKSTLSKIVWNYELLPFGENIRPSINVVTRSVNGVQIGMKPRIINGFC